MSDDYMRYSLDSADEKISDLSDALKELADSTRRFLNGYSSGLTPSPRLAEALDAADRVLIILGIHPSAPHDKAEG